jgi:RRXRR protein
VPNSAKENEVIPVVDIENKPLMLCSEKRSRLFMERKEATHFWKFDTFCIKLTKEFSSRVLQGLSVGFDFGSKREGFTEKI